MYVINPYGTTNNEKIKEASRKEAKKKFDEWYKKEKKNMNWIRKLPSCPKKLGKDNSNPNPAEWAMGSANNIASGFFWSQLYGNFHPGGMHELRTKNPGKYGGCGQQCIYDKCGNLISEIPAAGTADKVSSNQDRVKHYENDVQPYDWAREVGEDYINKYYEVRPTM